jgi:hypothetical protein
MVEGLTHTKKIPHFVNLNHKKHLLSESSLRVLKLDSQEAVITIIAYICLIMDKSIAVYGCWLKIIYNNL